MTNVKSKLEQKLKELDYNKRAMSGNVLSIDDINFLFEQLKTHDKELIPLLETLQTFCLTSLHNDYMMVEQQIKGILKYYNLLNEKDLLKSRHQLFFTEERKLVKKPFFNQDKLENVKGILTENNIYRRLGIK